MVTAGDSSGNLDIVFSKLADYLEEGASIKQKVISALTYPIVLIGFSIVVIISLLAFVLPQVVGQFIKAGAELPFITKFLIGISNNIIPILIIFAVFLARKEIGMTLLRPRRIGGVYPLQLIWL